MPTRIELPLFGKQSLTTCSANCRSASRELSMRVMARARIVRSPRRMPSKYSWGERVRRRAVARTFSSRGVSGATQPGRTCNALCFASTNSGVSSNRSAAQDLDNSLCRNRDHGARTKDTRRPGFVKKLVVLRRDDTSHDDENVTAIKLVQLVDQFRHQRLVTRGQRRHADKVHIVFHSPPHQLP